MLSKFLRSTYRSSAELFLTRKVTPKVNNVRCAVMIPPTQYDIPYPRKLRLGYTLKTYWEIIPLFLSTCTALGFMFGMIMWSCRNKCLCLIGSRPLPPPLRLCGLYGFMHMRPEPHRMIVYTIEYQVDVVFSSRSRENISRTMDLRNPTIHKLLIINQRYDPWYEMANTLDKLNGAEKRASMRAHICAHP